MTNPINHALCDDIIGKLRITRPSALGRQVPAQRAELLPGNVFPGYGKRRIFEYLAGLTWSRLEHSNAPRSWDRMKGAG